MYLAVNAEGKRLMVLVMERAIHDPEFRSIRHELYQRGVGNLRNLLCTAVKRGDPPANIHLEEIVSQLAGRSSTKSFCTTKPCPTSALVDWSMLCFAAWSRILRARRINSVASDRHNAP